MCKPDCCPGGSGVSPVIGILTVLGVFALADTLITAIAPYLWVIITAVAVSMVMVAAGLTTVLVMSLRGETPRVLPGLRHAPPREGVKVISVRPFPGSESPAAGLPARPRAQIPARPSQSSRPALGTFRPRPRQIARKSPNR
jgi:hypothetical protein